MGKIRLAPDAGKRSVRVWRGVTLLFSRVEFLAYFFCLGEGSRGFYKVRSGFTVDVLHAVQHVESSLKGSFVRRAVTLKAF